MKKDMVRKITAILISIAMLLCLAACGGSSATPSATAPNASSASSAASPEAASTTASPDEIQYDKDGVVILPDDGPVFNLTCADGWALGGFSQITSNVMKDFLAEYGKGKININFYHNNEMGSNREIFEAMQMGNIDIAYLVTSQQATFVPALSVFDLGNALDDFDAAVKTLSGGKFRNKLEEEYNNAGVELISMFPTGYRQLSTNREIHKLEDFKDMKLRTMETPFHMEYWRCLGANPTPLPIAEVYIAIQQGLVEGQENPLDIIIANKFYELNKYVVLTNHLLFINTFTMTKATWDEMPPAYQEFMLQGMRRMEEYAAINCKENFNTSREELIGLGMEFIELPDSEYDRIREAIQPLYSKIRESAGDEMVDLLLDEMKANASK